MVALLPTIDTNKRYYREKNNSHMRICSNLSEAQGKWNTCLTTDNNNHIHQQLDPGTCVYWPWLAL